MGSAVSGRGRGTHGRLGVFSCGKHSREGLGQVIGSLRRLHSVALLARGILYIKRFYHGYHVVKSAAVLVEPLPSPGLGYRAQGKQHGVNSISPMLLPQTYS